MGIPTNSCRGEGSKVRGQEGSEGHYQTPKVTDPNEAPYQAGIPTHSCRGGQRSGVRMETPKVTDPNKATYQVGIPTHSCGVKVQGSEGHYQTPKVTDPKGIRPQ